MTGRIAKVTLPTGGRISYAYSGESQGINCSDGSTATLTRTLNDDPAGSTWTYTTSTPHGAGTSHTEVLDGNGNGRRTLSSSITRVDRYLLITLRRASDQML